MLTPPCESNQSCINLFFFSHHFVVEYVQIPFSMLLARLEDDMRLCREVCASISLSHLIKKNSVYYSYVYCLSQVFGIDVICGKISPFCIPPLKIMNNSFCSFMYWNVPSLQHYHHAQACSGCGWRWIQYSGGWYLMRSVSPVQIAGCKSNISIKHLKYCHSTFYVCLQTLRGTAWKGRDCSDIKKDIHPGTRYSCRSWLPFSTSLTGFIAIAVNLKHLKIFADPLTLISTLTQTAMVFMWVYFPAVMKKFF